MKLWAPAFSYTHGMPISSYSRIVASLNYMKAPDAFCRATLYIRFAGGR